MSKVFVPENYHSQLNLIETEVAIKMIKDYFERRLSEELRLTRVSAPLFLLKTYEPSRLSLLLGGVVFV